MEGNIFIIGLMVSLICLMTLIMIFSKSVKKLILRSHNIKLMIKIIYFLTCLLSIIAVTNMIIFIVYCGSERYLIYKIGIDAYFVELGGVQGMLLLRLYFTFKESTFKISNCEKWTILIVYILQILISLAHLATYYIIFLLITGLIIFAFIRIIINLSN